MSASNPTPAVPATPPRPAFPPSRVEYETLAGSLFFASQEECDVWKAEPLWRRILGRTAYDRRLAAKPE